MLQYFVELVGTFFFLSVILVVVNAKYNWAALPIGLALSLMIFWGGGISGGHFNPAVSTMFLANNQISVIQYLGYVICQIVGGLLSLVYFKQYSQFIKK